MNDVPAIFSRPMVRALLREARAPGTGKTNTRRLAWGKPFGVDGHDDLAAADLRREYGWKVSGPDDTEHRIAWPPSTWQAVKPGDRLWVRESHWRWGHWEGTKKGGKISHRFQFDGAKSGSVCFDEKPIGPLGKFAQADSAWHRRPAIFHPRDLSRLTLVVTATKLERLQEISKDDVIREGITERDGQPITDVVAGWHEPFATLWENLHGAGAWDANPDVVALTFTVHLGNIDAMDKTARGELEITPEMIEAGQSCLDRLLDAATTPEEGLMCIPAGWAEAVYRAMRTIR